jgi:hypothetical protein
MKARDVTCFTVYCRALQCSTDAWNGCQVCDALWKAFALDFIGQTIIIIIIITEKAVS